MPRPDFFAHLFLINAELHPAAGWATSAKSLTRAGNRRLRLLDDEAIQRGKSRRPNPTWRSKAKCSLHLTTETIGNSTRGWNKLKPNHAGCGVRNWSDRRARRRHRIPTLRSDKARAALRRHNHNRQMTRPGWLAGKGGLGFGLREIIRRPVVGKKHHRVAAHVIGQARARRQGERVQLRLREPRRQPAHDCPGRRLQARRGTLDREACQRPRVV